MSRADSRSRSRSPRDVVADEEMTEARQKQAAEEWYPKELYKFFVEKAEVPEDEFIIDETVRLLQAKGTTQEWQFGLAPEAMIQQAFPMETHSRHLLAAMFAKNKYMERERAQRQAEAAFEAERVRAAQPPPQEPDNATARAILFLPRAESTASPSPARQRRHVRLRG